MFSLLIALMHLHWLLLSLSCSPDSQVVHDEDFHTVHHLKCELCRQPLTEAKQP